MGGLADREQSTATSTERARPAEMVIGRTPGTGALDVILGSNLENSDPLPQLAIGPAGLVARHFLYDLGCCLYTRTEGRIINARSEKKNHMLAFGVGCCADPGLSAYTYT